MTRGQVDLVDLLALPLFMLGGIVQLGWLPELPILSEVLLDLGDAGGTVEVATVVMLVALAFVLATNKPKLNGNGGAQLWVVMATVFLILGPAFVPLLGVVLTNAAAAAVAFLVQTAGYMTASFLG